MPEMEDFRIRSFMAVVRTGGVSAAAESLGVTQPAVSQHVKALEARYGVRLFVKKGNRPVPTDEGVLLYQHGERLESVYRLIERDLKNRSGSQRSYDVAATLTVAEYVLPDLIAGYRRERPDVRIRLAVQNTAGVIDRLLRNQSVLGIVEGPVERTGLLRTRIMEDDLVIVAAPDHPILDRVPTRGVPLARVLESELILREPGSGTREVFERYLLGRRIDPRTIHPYMEIGSINVIKSFVKSRMGITVVSSLAVRAEIERGELVQVRVNAPPIRREMQLVWTRESEPGFVSDFKAFCLR